MSVCVACELCVAASAALPTVQWCEWRAQRAEAEILVNAVNGSKMVKVAAQMRV